jgi:hypothetical protein
MICPIRDSLLLHSVEPTYSNSSILVNLENSQVEIYARRYMNRTLTCGDLCLCPFTLSRRYPWLAVAALVVDGHGYAGMLLWSRGCVVVMVAQGGVTTLLSYRREEAMLVEGHGGVRRRRRMVPWRHGGCGRHEFPPLPTRATASARRWREGRRPFRREGAGGREPMGPEASAGGRQWGWMLTGEKEEGEMRREGGGDEGMGGLLHWNEGMNSA